MSLPIHALRTRLQELIKISKRGYMATLSAMSGVPDGTIHRIAYGKQNAVTYKVWQQLHTADPQLPPPPAVDAETEEDNTVVKQATDRENDYFIAALQHLYPVDGKFHDFEAFALSVGLTEKAARALLSGDYAFIPEHSQKQVIAHSFGMSLDEFHNAGRRILLERNRYDLKDLDLTKKILQFDSATTTHPDIVQIVKMAEKLDDEKIQILKELTLKMLISHLNK